jgi:hypothetical protein
LQSNLEGCGIKIDFKPSPAMSDQEENLAIKVVMDECFDCTCNIGKTVENIAKNSTVTFDKVASLAQFVIYQRLKREFGKDFVPEDVNLIQWKDV